MEVRNIKLKTENFIVSVKLTRSVALNHDFLSVPCNSNHIISFAVLYVISVIEFDWVDEIKKIFTSSYRFASLSSALQRNYFSF
jgi:hypothetical protein